MTQARPPHARGSQTDDVPVRKAITLAFAAMAALTALDVTDGSLDLLYSVGFVLTVVTVPMAVPIHSLLPPAVLPPILLVVTLLAVSMIAPNSIQVDGMAKDAGTIARLIASLIDHGLTLVIGYAAALAVIAQRLALSRRP
jgi:flagellar biosynthesis component FlhA